MLIPHVRTANAGEPWAPLDSQVYSLAIADASLYQHVVLVARELANELHAATSAEELVAMWPQGVEMAGTAASARGLAASGLPMGSIAAAAFALRASEIRMLVQARARRDRIEAAKDAGADWVMLDESGAVGAGMLDPYRCLEMHLRSGWAIVCRTESSVTRSAFVFVVSIARLDPSSGNVLALDTAPDAGDSGELTTPRELAAWIEETRRRIEALASTSVRPG